MTTVSPMTRPRAVSLGVVLALAGILGGGCARPPTADPARAELLRQLREAYLFDVEVGRFEPLSVPEMVARLDPDTRVIELRRMSLDFIRGLEPEGSVSAVTEFGGGRGYLRLGFFGRRTLEDVRKALGGVTGPLCALAIDLRDNAGGGFESALRLAELFLPAGAPLAIYESREGRALRYAMGPGAPRRERLTLLINARTSSSAELFAGVLRWHGRAELVGSPTAGKRTVQRAVRLDEGRLLLLTTGRFMAPDGSLFGVDGLTPDREGVEDIATLTAPCADAGAGSP